MGKFRSNGMFLAVVIRGKSYNPTNMVAFELELGGYQDTEKKKKIITLLYLKREMAYCSIFCSNTAQTF